MFFLRFPIRSIFAPFLFLIVFWCTYSASAQARTGVLAESPQGVSIVLSDVEADARRLPDVTRRAALSREPNVKEQATALLVRRVMAAQAKAQQFDKDPVLAAEVQIAVDRVLADAVLKDIDRKSRPSDTELLRYARTLYDAEPERFNVPAQTRARHILIPRSLPDAGAKAEDIRKQLLNGGNFEQLAQQHSTDYGSAAKGGDLGFFSKGAMVPEFEAAVDALKMPGDLSPVVSTQFGLHIIRLEARRAAQKRPFDELRDTLVNQAANSLANEARQKAIEAIRADIKYHDAVIKEFAQRQGQTPGPANSR